MTGGVDASISETSSVHSPTCFATHAPSGAAWANEAAVNEAVAALLRRQGGATIEEISDAIDSDPQIVCQALSIAIASRSESEFLAVLPEAGCLRYRILDGAEQQF